MLVLGEGEGEEGGEGEEEASPPPFSNRGITEYANTGLRRAEKGEGEEVLYPLLYVRIPSLVGQARYMRYFSFR